MVAEKLEDLVAAFPNCQTVAYADLSIGMVLVAAGPAKLSREALDRLCSEADLTLGGDTGPLGDNPSQMSVSATQSSTKVFLRSKEEPGDALLCLCTPDIDLSSFLGRADACLGEVTGGAE